MRKIAIIRENLEGFKLPFSDLRLDGIEFNYFDIQVENRDLDKYFSDILKKVSEVKPEMIFIPCWIEQPLHYLGVRLAMHVRLSGIGGFNETPIVLMGVETDLEFYRNCTLSRFLNSDKIFYTSFSSESIIDFLRNFDWEKNCKVKIDLTDNLKFFDLTPPANYHSHHSIDNELALLRWSEYLKCDDRIPDEIKDNLQTGLYFKYQKALNPVNSPGTGNPYLISGNAKILLIDDEAEKGWENFYECFFQHGRQISFSTLSADFKSLNQEEIIEAARKKVEGFDADVVLLDLRLCDTDFTTNPQPEPKDLTGYKILEEIKKINKGIQVIITTASNKVWNYQSTHDLGANGYIVKGAASEVSEDIRILKGVIEKGIELSQFLKKVFEKCAVVESQIYSCPTEDDTEFDEFIKDLAKQIKIIENASSNIRLNSSITLDIVFLNCYNFLEKFKHHYLHEVDYRVVLGVEETGMNRYNYNSANDNIQNQGSFVRINQNDNPSWFNTLAGLFIDYFSLANLGDRVMKDLWDIKEARNHYIHGNKDKFQQSEILTILDLCIKITSSMKE